MDIIITGGLGFIGRYLSQCLLAAGHRVTAVGRSSAPKPIIHHAFGYLTADTTLEGDWQQTAATADTIINLAGCTIFKRWTRSYKRQLYDSRIWTTRRLVQALPENWKGLFLSASAVGYYGNGGERIVDEATAHEESFLGTLARDWETEASKAAHAGARVAIMRFGVVLGRGGGALEAMRKAFKWGLGGTIGNGAQWFPWIHQEDLTRAIQFLVENENAIGPFNCCAPSPVRNRELTDVLARLLHRPTFLPAPALLVKTLLGEFGDSLLASCRAVPKRLLRSGFKFRYADIESALSDLLTSPNPDSNPMTDHQSEV